MDREKIITIVLGLIVGIGLAATYFFGAKFLNFSKSKVSIKSPVKTSPQNKLPPPPPQTTQSLTLETPTDNLPTTDKNLKVSGSFAPNSTIILYDNTDEQVATSDGQGKFAFNTVLEEGNNQLVVSAFSADNKLQSVGRSVTLDINK